MNADVVVRGDAGVAEFELDAAQLEPAAQIPTFEHDLLYSAEEATNEKMDALNALLSNVEGSSRGPSLYDRLHAKVKEILKRQDVGANRDVDLLLVQFASMYLALSIKPEWLDAKIAAHQDTGTTTVRTNLISLVRDCQSIIKKSDKGGQNKLTKYSKVMGEVMVWLCIQHPDVWQKVPLIRSDGEVGFMVMPVPQPQIYTNYLATVKERRDHAEHLNKVAGQHVKDSDSLRKRFLASASVREGISVLFNMASGDERAEKRMQTMLKFALDDSSTQILNVLKEEFLPACRAENLEPTADELSGPEEDRLWYKLLQGNVQVLLERHEPSQASMVGTRICMQKRMSAFPNMLVYQADFSKDVLNALAWMAACLHQAQHPDPQTGNTLSEDVHVGAVALQQSLFLQYFQYQLWGQRTTAEVWRKAGFSPHATAAWAILLDMYKTRCGDLPVQMITPETLHMLPLSDVCKACPEVAAVLAKGGEPSIDAFLEALETDMLIELAKALNKSRESFYDATQDHFMKIYDNLTEDEKFKISFGSLNRDTLEEIRSLDKTSSMLKSVQWTDWPVLRYLGQLKADGVAGDAFEQLTLTHGVMFGTLIQSKSFTKGTQSFYSNLCSGLGYWCRQHSVVYGSTLPCAKWRSTAAYSNYWQELVREVDAGRDPASVTQKTCIFMPTVIEKLEAVQISWELGIKNQELRATSLKQVKTPYKAPASAAARLAIESTARQQSMMKPLLTRGKEARDFVIGAMFFYINYYTLPVIMPMLMLAIHGAKMNKEGKHADCRAITYGPNVLRCPLVQMAIHMASRLFLGIGQPLNETVAYCKGWMQSNLMTSQHPEPPFDPDTTNPSAAMDSRIRAMQRACFGRDLPKKQHTNRRDGAEEIVEQGGDEVDAARAGKWQQSTLGQVYSTSPSTSTLCWTHGYRSPKHFLPKHGYLVAPDSIKAKVFVSVIELMDGTKLNIKQAKDWVKSKEVRERLEEGNNLEKFIQVLDFLANVLAQTLPILEKMYPNHWLCNDHPIFQDENRHDLHDELWEDWAELQWKVYSLLVVHEHDSNFLQMTGDQMPPFAIPSSVRMQARRIGATFLSDDNIPDDVKDPVAAVALQESNERRARESQIANRTSAPADDEAEMVNTLLARNRTDLLAVHQRMQAIAEASDDPLVRGLAEGMMLSVRSCTSQHENFEQTVAAQDAGSILLQQDRRMQAWSSLGVEQLLHQMLAAIKGSEATRQMIAADNDFQFKGIVNLLLKLGAEHADDGRALQTLHRIDNRMEHHLRQQEGLTRIIGQAAPPPQDQSSEQTMSVPVQRELDTWADKCSDVKVDDALQAVCSGWVYKGKHYPPIGLGDYQIGGKTFNLLLKALRDEFPRSVALAQAIKADRLLVAASQVGTCEFERDASFDTAGFLRELRVLFMEMAVMRVLMCLNLPFIKVTTMNGETPETLPHPPDYQAANSSCVAGSIRMAHWLSSIMGDINGNKSTLRKFIYCCATGCQSNSNFLPLRVQPDGQHLRIHTSRPRYNTKAGRKQANAAGAQVHGASEPVSLDIPTEPPVSAPANAAGQEDISAAALICGASGPESLDTPLEMVESAPAYVAGREDIGDGAPVHGAPETESLDMPLQPPNKGTDMQPQSQAAVDAMAASDQSRCRVTDRDARNAAVVHGNTTHQLTAGFGTHGHLRTMDHVAPTSNPSSVNRAVPMSTASVTATATVNVGAAGDTGGAPVSDTTEGPICLGSEPLLSEVATASSIQALKDLLLPGNCAIGRRAMEHSWTTDILKARVRQVKEADPEKYAQEKQIRFRGEKSSEEGKGKKYPRGRLDSQGQASSPETDNTNAHTDSIPFVDLIAAVASSGGSARVHVPSCSVPEYGDEVFIHSCACLIDMRLLDLREVLPLNDDLKQLRADLLKCFHQHCKNIHQNPSLRTVCDAEASADSTPTIRLLKAIVERVKNLSAEDTTNTSRHRPQKRPRLS